MALESYSVQLLKDSPIDAIASLRFFESQGQVTADSEARLIGRWARTDPQEALCWVEEQENEERRASTRDVVLAGWANSAPYEPIEQIENQGPGHDGPGGGMNVAGIGI